MVGGNVDSLAASGGTGSITVPGATTDAAQQEMNIRAMPSHIAGMNMGQYTDLKTITDNVSTTSLGHASTDGIIQMLWNIGKSTPEDLTQQSIQNWYDTQSGTQLAQDEATAPIYNQISAASSPILNSIYGTNGNDPNLIYNIFTGANTPSGGPSGAQTTPTAASPNQTTSTPGETAAQRARAHDPYQH